MGTLLSGISIPATIKQQLPLLSSVFWAMKEKSHDWIWFKSVSDKISTLIGMLKSKFLCKTVLSSFLKTCRKAITLFRFIFNKRLFTEFSNVGKKKNLNSAVCNSIFLSTEEYILKVVYVKIILLKATLDKLTIFLKTLGNVLHLSNPGLPKY